MDKGMRCVLDYTFLFLLPLLFFFFFFFFFSPLLFHSISSSDDICSLALSPLNTSHTSPMMMTSLTREAHQTPGTHSFTSSYSFFHLSFCKGGEEGRRGGGEEGRRGGGEEGRRGGGEEGRRGGGEEGRRRGEDNLDRQSLLCWYLCYLCSSVSPQRRERRRRTSSVSWGCDGLPCEKFVPSLSLYSPFFASSLFSCPFKILRVPHAIKTRIYTEQQTRKKIRKRWNISLVDWWTDGSISISWKVSWFIIVTAREDVGGVILFWLSFVLFLFVVDISPWSGTFIIYHQIGCSMSWRKHIRVQIISRLF